MYMSRVWLDPSRRGARRLLASPQRIHAVVAGATAAEGQTARPLWRMDDSSSGLQLLVVSEREPDFTALLEQADVPVEDGWQTTAYAPFLDALQVGQRWRFRLTANPTRNVREVTDPTKLPRGKRVPVIGNGNLQGWFLQKAPAWGIGTNPEAFLVTGNRAEDFRKGASADGGTPQRVVITATQFDGTLEVRDTDALRSALTRGVGSAKAYGCGLLTLAPLR